MSIPVKGKGYVSMAQQDRNGFRVCGLFDHACGKGMSANVVCKKVNAGSFPNPQIQLTKRGLCDRVTMGISENIITKARLSFDNLY